MAIQRKEPGKRTLLVLGIATLGFIGFTIGIWKDWLFLKNICMMGTMIAISYPKPNKSPQATENKPSVWRKIFYIILVIAMAAVFSWIERNRYNY